MKKRDWNTILVVFLLAGLFGFALVTYILADRRPAETARQIQTTAQTADPNASPQATPPEPTVMEIFGAQQDIPGEPRVERWTTIIPRIIVRLALAAFLAALLAFRPRK